MRELFSRKNALLDGAKETDVKNIAYILAMPILMSLLGEIIALPILIPFYFTENNVEWINLLLKLIVGTGSVIIAYFLWIKLFEKRKISSIGLRFNSSFLKRYLKGFSIGALLMIIDTLLIVFLAGGKISINKNLSIEFIGIILALMIGWIIQGAEEEIMMRGHMMPMLSKRMSVVVSVIISSLYFSALHLVNPSVGVLSIINLFLFGVSAAIYALKEESIVSVCAFHSAWNFVQGNIFGFPVSGQKVSDISIFSTEVKSNILDGGAFGPEGGLIETIVVIIFIAILFIRYKNKV